MSIGSLVTSGEGEARTERLARCASVHEPDGGPCTGTLVFNLGDLQARCRTCGR